MSKSIALTRGKFAIVDDADFEWLNQYKWCYQPNKHNAGYAMRTTGPRAKQTTIYMHRLILGAGQGQQLDHRNRNGLDNRRANLRFCSTAQNAANRQKPRGYNNRYKGVTWRARCCKWEAAIKVNGKTLYLGRFSNEREAAHAYDMAAQQYFGEFARLNLDPQTWKRVRATPLGQTSDLL